MWLDRRRRRGRESVQGMCNRKFSGIIVWRGKGCEATTTMMMITLMTIDDDYDEVEEEGKTE